MPTTTTRPPRRPATRRERVPLRTCVGCGTSAPQGTLVRFTEVDGVLTPAATGGRGAYTCRNAACFERALAQRAFSRTFRRPVIAEPELARLYTEESHG